MFLVCKQDFDLVLIIDKNIEDLIESDFRKGLLVIQLNLGDVLRNWNGFMALNMVEIEEINTLCQIRKFRTCQHKKT